MPHHLLPHHPRSCLAHLPTCCMPHPSISCPTTSYIITPCLITPNKSEGAAPLSGPAHVCVPCCACMHACVRLGIHAHPVEQVREQHTPFWLCAGTQTPRTAVSWCWAVSTQPTFEASTHGACVRVCACVCVRVSACARVCVCVHMCA